MRFFSYFLLLIGLSIGFSKTTVTGGGGTGDVSGGASSADNAIVVFDGTDGKTLQYITDAPLIDSTGNIVMQDAVGSSISCFIGFDTTGDCSGLYVGAGGPTSEMGIGFNGTNVSNWNATSYNFYIRSYFAPAACSAPGLGVRTDTNTGFCRNEADHLAIATDGVARLSAYGEAVETVGVPHYISGAGIKLIMTSPDGTCSECGPDNSDAWSCASVTCPTSP